MAKKTVRRRVTVGSKPTPPTPPAKPRKPRSTSAKQGGQAAAKTKAPTPKPAPRPTPKPSITSAAKTAATQAAKTTFKFASPAKKVTAAVGAAKAAVGLASRASAKATAKDRFPKAAAAVAVSKNPNLTRNRAAVSIGGGATAMAYGGATAKYRARTGQYPAGAAPKKSTATPAKRIPGMSMSMARQEVALAKRTQERKQLATTGTAKKVTAKQTEWRVNRRRSGATKEAMLLAKQNRNRPRG
jgi:hypothetical protein